MIPHVLVRRMPLPVEFGPINQDTGVDLSDISSHFKFLFVFDSNSTLSRKNPLAAVNAFKEAFPTGNEPAALVLKTM